MNDIFAGILPFTATAEERSFRKAAQRLGVTTAAVSKAIAKLEEDLGVRLLHRTSRQVSLTAEGELYLTRCREAIAQVQGGRELVMHAQREPMGWLSATLPFILGRRVIPALERLAAAYPALSFRLLFTDRYSRLIDEHIDVAVRIGSLEDSSLMARLLTTTRWVTLASPDYLARCASSYRPEVPAAVLRHPDDLQGHACLKFLSPQGTVREWTFRSAPGEESIQVKTASRVVLDHGELLIDAALGGMGICQVLDFMVGDHVREGRLTEVLEDYAAPGPPIHALYLPGQQSSPKVRVFLQFLLDLFHGDEQAGKRLATSKDRH